MKTIADRIAAEQAERDRITSLIAPRMKEARQIGAAITAATSARDAALIGKRDALILDAVGDGAAGALASAIEALATAETTLEAAVRRQPEADELAGTVQGLNERAAEVDRRIAALRAEQAVEVVALLKAERDACINLYEAAGAETVKHLARLHALDAHLMLSEVPSVLPADSGLTYLPRVSTQPAATPSFRELVQAERARISAEVTQ